MGEKMVWDYYKNRAYIKVRTELVNWVMQIFTEMREAYVYDNVSYQEIEGGERSFRKIIESIGISLALVYFILKRIFKVKYISARWILVPHILTNNPKGAQVQTAMQ